MSTPNGRSIQVSLYEGSGSARLADEERFEILSELLDHGYRVTVSDSTRAGGESNGSAAVVLGRFTDKTVAEANRAGDEEHATFWDITGQDAAGVLSAVERIGATVGNEPPGGWKPWFPVIDFDRCTNCMQCLSFCLFDVYAVDDKGQITVRNQDKCKTDCPACSRVCPEVAILFPKYGEGPINGDVVRDTDVVHEAMKVDVSSLLGGDVYAALRARQTDARKRFSTERDESRALIERRRCLKKVQGALDIPSEVLMSLPSIGDITERVERAKAKAEKRRARSQTVRDERPAASNEDWGI